MTILTSFNARSVFSFVAGAFLLSGCATEIMTEKQCLAGDWYGAGLEDGAEGRREGAIDERINLCAKYGAGVDVDSYFAGRDAALAQLCTDRGGYQYGYAGKAYLGVCGARRDPVFLGGYLEGRRIFAAEAERNAARDIYNQAVSAVEGYREDMRRARRKLDDPDSSDEDRKQARNNLDYARDRLPVAERASDDALYELGRADEALAQTTRSIASWRRSDEFLTLRATLSEAHEFARAERAVDYCTDDFDGHYPRCEILPGAALRDNANGAVCAYGPGEARFVRRSQRRDGRTATGYVHSYDFYPRDPGRDRLARRANGGFDVYFGTNGDYQGAACSVLP